MKQPFNVVIAGIAGRNYQDYESYVLHQQSKIRAKTLTKTAGLRDVLKNKMEALDILSGGESVLCLGARAGGEVQAFIELNTFAIGIDLKPWPDDVEGGNHYVMYGDFHQLQFADQSIDVIYCNSFDHVKDLKKVISEIRRVLKPDGMFILEMKPGRLEMKGKEKYNHVGGMSDGYDCMEWEHRYDLLSQVCVSGFMLNRYYKNGKHRNAPHGYLLRSTLRQ